MIIGADDGTMRLNEVSAAYDAQLTEGAFDAHLTRVHSDPAWYPKTGLAQNSKSKFGHLVGLARYFNSSVDEIDVFVIHGKPLREFKFEDFPTSMKTVCDGKENKAGQSKLKRAIRFRKA